MYVRDVMWSVLYEIMLEHFIWRTFSFEMLGLSLITVDCLEAYIT